MKKAVFALTLVLSSLLGQLSHAASAEFNPTMPLSGNLPASLKIDTVTFDSTSGTPLLILTGDEIATRTLHVQFEQRSEDRFTVFAELGLPYVKSGKDCEEYDQSKIEIRLPVSDIRESRIQMQINPESLQIRGIRSHTANYCYGHVMNQIVPYAAKRIGAVFTSEKPSTPGLPNALSISSTALDLNHGSPVLILNGDALITGRYQARVERRSGDLHAVIADIGAPYVKSGKDCEEYDQSRIQIETSSFEIEDKRGLFALEPSQLKIKAIRAYASDYCHGQVVQQEIPYSSRSW